MTTPVTAVYPGTFDPMTLGHVDLVRRAAGLFDQLIVVVAAGVHKKGTMFTLEERMQMVQAQVQPFANVSVQSFSGLMRDFVRAHGAQVMVRGLRSATDFDYEFQLAGMNRSLMADVETIFLTPSDQYLHVSSTYVREITLLGGEVSKHVDPLVEKALLAKYRAQTT
jgi:pantetheine-phosphate adenylyltransferase